MRMPGFNAEASLYGANERYRAATRTQSDGGGASVRPAGILDIIFDPCSYCFRNCARQQKTPVGGRDCLMACSFAGLC